MKLEHATTRRLKGATTAATSAVAASKTAHARTAAQRAGEHAPLKPAGRPVDTTPTPAASKALTLRLPGVVTQRALLDLVASFGDAQWFTGKGRAVKSVDIA